MGMLGFSINMLTLFGLVLAIGIVVDDAIVIVENAAHHIDHGGLPAKEATIKAMSEVIGPIIGITLVLMAVFLPTAFLGGITGQLYRQFALTIAATAIISAINAVTLKPAQCATYLRPTKAKKNLFYRAFNKVYGRCEARLHEDHSPRGAACRGDDAGLRRARRAFGLVVHAAAHRLPADGRPGIRDPRRAATGRRLPDANQGGGRQGQRDPQADARRAVVVPDRWSIDHGSGGGLERFGDVHHVHAMVRARWQEGAQPG